MRSLLLKYPMGWPGAHQKHPPFAKEINSQRISTEVISASTIEVTVAVAGRVGENTEILPCLSIATDLQYGYQTQIVYTSRALQGSACLAGIGAVPPESLREEAGTDEVSSEVDLFLAKMPLKDVKIVFHVFGSDIARLIVEDQYLLSVSLAEKRESEQGENEELLRDVALLVPQKSQMTFPEEIRRRICSPTSIHMVQAYYGVDSSVTDIAEKAYNANHDMYGIWPQNIWAISSSEMVGYICRIKDFNEVGWFLRRGIPLIASISYEAGELRDAAIERTPGHLVVVVGIQGEYVICNDPAAVTDGEVRRRYKRSEFRRVWIDKKGIAYVLIRKEIL